MDNARLRQLAQQLLDEGYADSEAESLDAARRILAAAQERRHHTEDGRGGSTSDDLDKLIERYHAALTPFAKGDPKPVMDLYSRADDVMVANPFGPAVRGWPAASQRLDFASSRMHDGEVTGFAEVARYQSGNLVVLHETENWQSRIADRDDVEPWQLRVTTTFRCEDSEWRVIHRHADPIQSVHPHGPLRNA